MGRACGLNIQQHGLNTERPYALWIEYGSTFLAFQESKWWKVDREICQPQELRQSDAKRLDHVDGSGRVDGNLGSTPSRSTDTNMRERLVGVGEQESLTWPVRLTVGLMILSHETGVRHPHGLLDRCAESRNRVRFPARRSITRS